MERTRNVLSLIRVSGKPQVDRTGIPRQIEDIATICKRENRQQIASTVRVSSPLPLQCEGGPTVNPPQLF